jgi:cobalamin biosynthesis protein CobT
MVHRHDLHLGFETPTTKGDTMSRTIIARGAALAATTILALTACGGTDEAPAEQDQGAGVAEQEADDSGASDAGGAAEDDEAAQDDAEGSEEDAEDEGEGAAAAGEGTVVEIGTELTDEETGDVVTIVSAVRNNPTEYYMASDNPDGEMVYLEVKVVPGEQFGGVVSQQDFLLDDGGEEVNYASTADDELTEAGYTYFDGASRRDGEATGYIPIYVEQTGDVLKGAYVRPEAKILGDDETIPEFRGEFEIPAA